MFLRRAFPSTNSQGARAGRLPRNAAECRRTRCTPGISGEVGASSKSKRLYGLRTVGIPRVAVQPVTHSLSQSQFVGPLPALPLHSLARSAARQREPPTSLPHSRSACLSAAVVASWRPHIQRAPSASKRCCLTPRSSGPPTAWHIVQPAHGLRPILRRLAAAPSRRGPLSSNVRPQKASALPPSVSPSSRGERAA